MDKIIIKGLRIFAYHGVNEEEKEKGQIFIVDATIYADLLMACYSDDIKDTISYAKIVKIIRKSLTEKNFNLLEAAAQYVIDNIFKEFDEIDQIELRLMKPRAPIAADFDYTGVEIFRGR